MRLVCTSGSDTDQRGGDQHPTGVLVNGGFGKAPKRPKISPKSASNGSEIASNLSPKLVQMAPRNPQEPLGIRRKPEEGGGVCYLDSPSLNVALGELGFTFLALFMWVFKTPVSETPITDAPGEVCSPQPNKKKRESASCQTCWMILLPEHTIRQAESI
jgi:hypothetical protein